MPTLELTTAGRQFRRQFGAAIRKNLVRALTELITNSDDSYRRMDNQQSHNFGKIDILFDRQSRWLAVLDHAEGMDAEDMESMYPLYGGATSGLYEDFGVRGYFGKGLKDVLFSMDDGKVRSIKNGQLYTANFHWMEDRPTITIDEDVQKVTPAIRKRLGFGEGNGTQVSFRIPAELPLPQHESLLRNLSNFYMLRLINANPDRSLILETRYAKHRQQVDEIVYRFPEGDLVLEDAFIVEQEEPLRVEIQLSRAQTQLTQAGEDREGGLLIFDDEQTVLDLTLFDYDYEEFASHLFGLVEVHNFRSLLKADENVLSDTRDGLDRHHPFTKALAEAVESRLRPVVEHERHIYLKNAPKNLSRKQHKRLVDSVDRINSLLHNLADLQFSFQAGGIEDIETPPDGGMGFSPGQIKLRKGSHTVVRLRIDTSIIHPGVPVSLSSNNTKVSFQPDHFEVPSVPGQLVITENVILSSSRQGEQAKIEAKADVFRADLEVEVTGDEYPMPEDGLAFIPPLVRVPNNSQRTAKLYLHKSVTKPGDKVRFTIKNPKIRLAQSEVRISRSDFKGPVALINIPVKGTGIGTLACLQAKIKGHTAEMTVEVISKAERRPKEPLLLAGYRFDQVTPSRVRASYDDETGLIWIYLKNPIVQRYFNDLPLEVALNTPHCQILLAEIILEQIAWVARRKMIESGAAMYLSSDHTEEDLSAVRKFMNEYGDKIHSWITDEQVINQVVKNIEENFAFLQEQKVP